MTYLHKVKCLHCQLHFTAFSWEAEWFPRGCPECKTLFEEVGGYMHWMDQTNLQIYEFVPGPSKGLEPVTMSNKLHPNDTPVES